ncbi:protein of unknown function [Paraburkholderia dioscoreae]|uniref:Uncharacterized protein n=1 Tax=Paraburkholderia dioscoreae TaxID=2604047 RepID=A0A5Q4YT54_9BURK|nr:protein of unknown function [Paraburkholderia dioscoreae]
MGRTTPVSASCNSMRDANLFEAVLIALLFPNRKDRLNDRIRKCVSE